MTISPAAGYGALRTALRRRKADGVPTSATETLPQSAPPVPKAQVKPDHFGCHRGMTDSGENGTDDANVTIYDVAEAAGVAPSSA